MPTLQDGFRNHDKGGIVYGSTKSNILVLFASTVLLFHSFNFNFSLVLIAVNKPTGIVIAPSNWRQKNARQRRAHALLFNLFLYAIYIYIKFSIIRSFCKPCHMPFRKLIPSFTLTATYTRFRRQNTTALARYPGNNGGKKQFFPRT